MSAITRDAPDTGGNGANARPPARTRRNPSLRERVGALRNLPPFLREIWATSRALTIASLGLRLVRALLPIATLYVGKLIIDEAVRLVGSGLGFDDARRAPGAAAQLDHLAWLLALEFGAGDRCPTCSAAWSATPTRCCRSCSPTPPACG